MSDIFDLFRKLEKKKETVQPISVLVACLGNPGKEYAFTRHNSGFLFAEYYSQKKNFQIDRSKFDGLCGETTLGGVRALFLCPTTYMNCSGTAVRKAADFYKIPPEKIFVVCDDVNFEVGKLRIRKKGSDGGQKGLRDIIGKMGSEDIPRIRIGVGKKPTPDYDLADWVLGQFSKEDRKTLEEVFCRCGEALELAVQGKFEEAMGKYN